jgi:hypothetical protein
VSSPDLRADYGDRDRSIALNSYTTVKGRDSVPENKFRAYWRDVHGPLCSRVPGLGWYAQHHFAGRRDGHLWPLPDGVTALPGYQLDGAVEIGWESADARSEFQEASSILFSDEQNVFDETVAYALAQGSVTAFDRQRDPVPNGDDPYDRVHVHFTPQPGRAADLADWLRTTFAGVAEASDLVVKVRVHAPEPVDNSVPSPPAPNVRHEVVAERLALVILEIAFDDAIARRRFFASDAFTTATAALADLAAHITAFPVSAVYTFVRDGQLTTAGLRGSRVAELIDDLAALNQIGDDVWHLMHTGRLGETGS